MEPAPRSHVGGGRGGTRRRWHEEEEEEARMAWDGGARWRRMRASPWRQRDKVGQRRPGWSPLRVAQEISS
eukprot:scaffold527_cov368-Prasinococcus_capsulatus_cf.AAC.48